jgi:hypothetical protein
MQNMAQRPVIDTFTEKCPYCKVSIEPNFRFCHKCGSCLILWPSTVSRDKPFTVDELKCHLKDADLFFMMWLSSVVLLGLSGLAYYMTASTSFIIAATAALIYSWAILVVKLDIIVDGLGKSSTKLVYLGILIPVIGTILSYANVVALSQSFINNQT